MVNYLKYLRIILNVLGLTATPRKTGVTGALFRATETRRLPSQVRHFHVPKGCWSPNQPGMEVSKKNVKCFECFEVSRKNRTHGTNSGIRTVFWMFWMVFVAKYVAEKTCGTVSRNDSDAKNDLEWSWILCPISSSLKAELFLILAFFQANHPVLEHGNGKPPFIIYSWFSH